MPTTQTLEVRQLRLDLANFRTTPQKNEISAIRAMIAINPDWFWALAESLLDDGYHITENILVMQKSKGADGLIVKEGNRRIAVLKICHGHVRRSGLDIPSHIQERIADLSVEWKAANHTVPCAVYSASEADAVDRIVTLTHGKGEKAGRDIWKAVARARHSRDMNQTSQPALDILELYLRHGQNLTENQKERWAGDYPLTVLEELLKRLAPRFNAASAREFADQYPRTIKHRNAVEEMLRDIGLKQLGFPEIRDKDDDFALTKYRIPVIQSAQATAAAQSTSTNKAASTASGGASSKQTAAASKTKAAATDDPRAVIRALKSFVPVGNHREKLVTLLTEARKLKLEDHPHAFCFLLRSMFEISAKAYCRDHAKSAGPTATKPNGDDRILVDVLRDITKHLTNNNTDRAMTKSLHGAMAEMAKATGFLSVTSMNQLVHNPRFSVKDTHISALFFNVFPLLEAMNV